MKSFLKLYKQINRRAIESLKQSPELYWRSRVSLILVTRTLPAIIDIYLLDRELWDLGAGDQMYQTLFNNRLRSYKSLDITTSRSQVDVVADIENLPIKDNSLESVYSAQVLEHVPAPWHAFIEINRVLKPNGVAVITVPHLGYLHNLPHDYYRFTEFGLRALAKQAHLQVEQVIPLGGLFCFFGYIRSTIFQPLYGLPVLSRGVLVVNYLISLIEIWLDNSLGLTQLFPLNYLMVVRKVSIDKSRNKKVIKKT